MLNIIYIHYRDAAVARTIAKHAIIPEQMLVLDSCILVFIQISPAGRPVYLRREKYSREKPGYYNS